MKPTIPMRSRPTRVVAALMSVAALAMLATQAQAAEPARWQAIKLEIGDKKTPEPIVPAFVRDDGCTDSRQRPA